MSHRRRAMHITGAIIGIVVLIISYAAMTRATYAIDFADTQCDAGDYECAYPGHHGAEICKLNKPCQETKDGVIVAGICTKQNFCHGTSVNGKAPNQQSNPSTPTPLSTNPAGTPNTPTPTTPTGSTVETGGADTTGCGAYCNGGTAGPATPSTPAQNPASSFRDLTNPFAPPAGSPPTSPFGNLSNTPFNSSAPAFQDINQLVPEAMQSVPNSPTVNPLQAFSGDTFSGGSSAGGQTIGADGLPVSATSVQPASGFWNSVGNGLSSLGSSLVSGTQAVGGAIATGVSDVGSAASNLLGGSTPIDTTGNPQGPYSSSGEGTNQGLETQNGNNAATNAFDQMKGLSTTLRTDTNTINSLGLVTDSNHIGSTGGLVLTGDYASNAAVFQQTIAGNINAPAGVTAGTLLSNNYQFASQLTFNNNGHLGTFNSAGSFSSDLTTSGNLYLSKTQGDVTAYNSFATDQNISLAKLGGAIESNNAAIVDRQTAISNATNQIDILGKAGVSTQESISQYQTDIKKATNEINALQGQNGKLSLAADAVDRGFASSGDIKALAVAASSPDIAAKQGLIVTNLSAATNNYANPAPGVSTYAGDYSAIPVDNGALNQAAKLDTTTELLNNAHAYADSINNSTALNSTQQNAVDAATGKLTGWSYAATQISSALAAPVNALAPYADPIGQTLLGLTVGLPSAVFDSGVGAFGPTTANQMLAAGSQTDVQNTLTQVNNITSSVINAATFGQVVTGSLGKIASEGFSIAGTDVTARVYNEARGVVADLVGTDNVSNIDNVIHSGTGNGITGEITAETGLVSPGQSTAPASGLTQGDNNISDILKQPFNSDGVPSGGGPAGGTPLPQSMADLLARDSNPFAAGAGTSETGTGGSGAAADVGGAGKSGAPSVPTSEEPVYVYEGSGKSQPNLRDTQTAPSTNVSEGAGSAGNNVAQNDLQSLLQQPLHTEENQLLSSFQREFGDVLQQPLNSSGPGAISEGSLTPGSNSFDGSVALKSDTTPTFGNIYTGDLNIENYFNSGIAAAATNDNTVAAVQSEPTFNNGLSSLTPGYLNSNSAISSSNAPGYLNSNSATPEAAAPGYLNSNSAISEQNTVPGYLNSNSATPNVATAPGYLNSNSATPETAGPPGYLNNTSATEPFDQRPGYFNNTSAIPVAPSFIPGYLNSNSATPEVAIAPGYLNSNSAIPEQNSAPGYLNSNSAIPSSPVPTSNPSGVTSAPTGAPQKTVNDNTAPSTPAYVSPQPAVNPFPVQQAGPSFVYNLLKSTGIAALILTSAPITSGVSDAISNINHGLGQSVADALNPSAQAAPLTSIVNQLDAAHAKLQSDLAIANDPANKESLTGLNALKDGVTTVNNIESAASQLIGNPKVDSATQSNIASLIAKSKQARGVVQTVIAQYDNSHIYDGSMTTAITKMKAVLPSAVPKAITAAQELYKAASVAAQNPSPAKVVTPVPKAPTVTAPVVVPTPNVEPTPVATPGAPVVVPAQVPVAGPSLVARAAPIVGNMSVYDSRLGGMNGSGILATGGQFDPASYAGALQLDLAKTFHTGYGQKATGYALVEVNGRKLIIKVNDNGPLRPGRILDGTPATMNYLVSGADYDSTLHNNLLTNVKVTLLQGEYTTGPVTGATTPAITQVDYAIGDSYAVGLNLPGLSEKGASPKQVLEETRQFIAAHKNTLDGKTIIVSSGAPNVWSKDQTNDLSMAQVREYVPQIYAALKAVVGPNGHVIAEGVVDYAPFSTYQTKYEVTLDADLGAMAKAAGIQFSSLSGQPANSYHPASYPQMLAKALQDANAESGTPTVTTTLRAPTPSIVIGQYGRLGNDTVVSVASAAAPVPTNSNLVYATLKTSDGNPYMAFSCDSSVTANCTYALQKEITAELLVDAGKAPVDSKWATGHAVPHTINPVTLASPDVLKGLTSQQRGIFAYGAYIAAHNADLSSNAPSIGNLATFKAVKVGVGDSHAMTPEQTQQMIDTYIFGHYQMTPKFDNTGDFTWKDVAAAKQDNKDLQSEVVGNIKSDFKLNVYKAFQAMEAAGLHPGITSGYRSNYRQSITEGFHALPGLSLHEQGLAMDIVGINGTSNQAIWNWIDENGQQYGIGRPYLAQDAPHIGPTNSPEYTKRRGESSLSYQTVLASQKTQLGAVAAVTTIGTYNLVDPTTGVTVATNVTIPSSAIRADGTVTVASVGQKPVVSTEVAAGASPSVAVAPVASAVAAAQSDSHTQVVSSDQSNQQPFSWWSGFLAAFALRSSRNTKTFTDPQTGKLYMTTNLNDYPVLHTSGGGEAQTSAHPGAWSDVLDSIIDTTDKYNEFERQYLASGVPDQASLDLISALGDKLYGTDKLMTELKSTYDITVSPQYQASVLNPETIPALSAQRAHMIQMVSKEAAKYPQSFWKNMPGIHLEINPRAPESTRNFAGSAGQKNGESYLWLSVSQSTYMKGVFHHELAHRVDKAAGYFPQDKRWGITAYGTNNYEQVYANNFDGNTRLRSTEGFICDYGCANQGEDKATISESMFVNYKDVMQVAQADPILAAKVTMVKEAYLAASNGAMNDTYWENLTPTEPNYSIARLKTDLQVTQAADGTVSVALPSAPPTVQVNDKQVINATDANSLFAKIYAVSPELQMIVRLPYELTSDQVANLAQVMGNSLKQTVGVQFKFVGDDEVTPLGARLDSVVRDEYGNVVFEGKNGNRNYGLWDEKNKVVYFRDSMFMDPDPYAVQNAIAELQHEVGAVYLGTIFGGKANIPYVDLKDAGKEASTHLLDAYGIQGNVPILQNVVDSVNQMARYAGIELIGGSPISFSAPIPTPDLMTLTNEEQNALSKFNQLYAAAPELSQYTSVLSGAGLEIDPFNRIIRSSTGEVVANPFYDPNGAVVFYEPNDARAFALKSIAVALGVNGASGGIGGGSVPPGGFTTNRGSVGGSGGGAGGGSGGGALISSHDTKAGFWASLIPILVLNASSQGNKQDQTDQGSALSVPVASHTPTLRDATAAPAPTGADAGVPAPALWDVTINGKTYTVTLPPGAVGPDGSVDVLVDKDGNMILGADKNPLLVASPSTLATGTPDPNNKNNTIYTAPPGAAPPAPAPVPQPHPGTEVPVAVPEHSRYTNIPGLGAGGGGGQSTPSPLPRPIMSPLLTPTLSCTPSTVTSTSTPITIRWSCISGTPISSGFSTGGRASGQVSFPASAASASSQSQTTLPFSLFCVSAAQRSPAAQCSVTVQSSATTTPMHPVAAIIANPNFIVSGSKSILSWTSQNATTCTVTTPAGLQIGSQSTSSTATTPALTKTTLFTETCTGSAGTVIATTSVTVR
jgi:hypothetical protein